MDGHEIEGHEVIDGRPKPPEQAHVLVLKDWRGADVKVVRTTRTHRRVALPPRDDQGVYVLRYLDGQAAMVREHFCSACDFEAARDANAGWNILFRGLEDVGAGYSESTSSERLHLS